MTKYQYTPFDELHIGEYAGERNDCAVRALSNVAELPYGAAHRHAELSGRTKTKGMTVTSIRDMFNMSVLSIASEAYADGVRGTGRVANYAVKEYAPTVLTGSPRVYPTLAQVQRKFPKNRLYLVKRGHAFAMVHGKVLDSAPIGARTRVRHIFVLEAL